MTRESLGLLGYESYTFVVENLARSRSFYTEKFDFREIAHASRAQTERSGEASLVLAAGETRVQLVSPLNQSSEAARYLRRHPAGISTISFRVRDLDRTRALLVQRGATPLGDEVDESLGGGRYRSFSVATPLGDVSFRFVERSDFPEFAPGFEATAEAGPANRYGIQRIDHVTSNARTMKPVVDWYREVLGMEQFWEIAFHTDDVKQNKSAGTGLKSIVMWDPESGIKFATNEPLAPFFEASQIAKFCYDNRGPGIQHMALLVPDILGTVGDLRERKIPFVSTAESYYRALPERLAQLHITNVKEDLAALEKLEIEIDGANDRYMLQIFLREAASYHDDERAGPFFYEIIQRAGDEGFGYGNFRALFESIERFQQVDTVSPPG